MDELTQRVFTLLSTQNLHPLHGGGTLTLPRLRSPMTVVYPTAQSLECVAAGDLLARDGIAVTGRLLTQKMAADVYAPHTGGAEVCIAHALKVANALFASAAELGLVSVQVGECSYNRQLDCRICPVSFTLRMYRYTTSISP